MMVIAKDPLSEKVKVKCNSCDKTFQARPFDKKCPHCDSEDISRTFLSFFDPRVY